MERIKLAEKIISTCREMNASGLNQGTSGNVSARYTGGMLITPSGIAYSKMTPDMIVFVDDKGKPEAGKIPSSEWLIHLACYKARPELNAVIHTHAVNSTAVAIHNHSIPAIHYMVAVSGTDHIPCIPYYTFGSPELADGVSKGIRESKSLLMQHHGMLVWTSRWKRRCGWRVKPRRWLIYTSNVADYITMFPCCLKPK